MAMMHNDMFDGGDSFIGDNDNDVMVIRCESLEK